MPDIRAIAAEIKRRISAFDAGQAIGLNPDKQGYCRCPFHEEKTGSLKLYHGERGWHCYGCGAGGSVIDLVMRYYDLAIWPALVRINSDFNLGLHIVDEKPTSRQEEKRAVFRRQLEEEERRINEKAAQTLLEAYYSVSDLAAVLHQQMRENRPTAHSCPFNDKFIDAANSLPFAREAAEELAVWIMDGDSG